MFNVPRLIATFVIVSVCASVLLWFAFGERLEISYRLRALDRLAREDLVVTANGYAIDETRAVVEAHRDRLAELGVFFAKTYRLGDLGPDERRQLIHALELNFPGNRYWELSHDNALQVWDFPSQESAWDSFIHTSL